MAWRTRNGMLVGPGTKRPLYPGIGKLLFHAGFDEPFLDFAIRFGCVQNPSTFGLVLSEGRTGQALQREAADERDTDGELLHVRFS